IVGKSHWCNLVFHPSLQYIITCVALPVFDGCSLTRIRISKRGASTPSVLHIQAQAWFVVPLSIAEIRRLIWHLGWELKKSMLFRLHWTLRQQHQTVAQFHHYKRRQAQYSQDLSQ
ncbi:MAG: hypothetical protein ACP5RH_12525, partial [Leptodesmis sp.]|uniref:hypothetical protein n=1 Tax=Leptodesmis sp. TaxID=3100501 RepID=UPI003D0D5D6F